MEKSRRKSVKPIARKRHNFIYLLLAILFGIATIYLLISFPPEYIIQVASIGIPILPIFLASLLLFIYSTLTFIFIQKTQGIIICLLTFSYLVLRLLGLTHWIFAVLFLALLIALEFFIYKQK